MKCPGCNFICSELRDICPECLVDLRPYKAERGLPVVKPEATYQELCGTPLKLPRPKSSHTSVMGHLRQLALRLAGKANPPQAAIEVQIPSGLRPEGASSDAHPLQSPDPIPAEEPPLSFTEQDVFVTLDAPTAPPPAPEPVAMVVQEEKVEIAQDPPPENSRPFTNILFIDQQMPTLNYPSGVAFLWPEQTQQEVEHAETEEPQQLPVEAQVQMEASTTVDAGQAVHSITPTYSYLEADPAIRECFRAAYAEIPSARLSDEIDLRSARVFTDKETARIKVLFDLGFESLMFGAPVPTYKDDINLSENRAVENSALVAQLQKFEKFIESASSTPTLKKRPHSDLDTPTPELILEPIEVGASLVDASIPRRAVAFAIDAAILCSASVAAALYLEGSDSQMALTKCVTLGECTPDSYISLIVAAAILPTFFLGYALLACCIKTTIGIFCCKLRITTLVGKTPRKRHVFVRTALLPISILFGGWLPVLLRKSPWHDRLAHVRLQQTL